MFSWVSIVEQSFRFYKTASLYSNRLLTSIRKTPLCPNLAAAWIQFAIRILFSGGLIVDVNEVANENELFGALVASLPLLFITAPLCLYGDAGDRKSRLCSEDIFWLFTPSLLFFCIYVTFLCKGLSFTLVMNSINADRCRILARTSPLLWRRGLVMRRSTFD